MSTAGRTARSSERQGYRSRTPTTPRRSSTTSSRAGRSSSPRFAFRRSPRRRTGTLPCCGSRVTMAATSLERMGRLVASILAGREDVGGVRRRLESAGIAGSFFVCTTPRTGSTMFVYALAESRAVGLAAEHFNPLTVPRESDRRIGDHLVDCTGKAGGTGVFGTKLHWSHLEPFLARLRRLRGARGLSDGRLIEAVFPTPRYIALTRDDTLAQAVSWWRAKITRVWLDDDEQVADPVFDFDAIDERVRMAREHDAAWQRWF